jgi:hypothetical protein
MKVTLYPEQFARIHWDGPKGEMYALADGYGIHVVRFHKALAPSGRVKFVKMYVESAKTKAEVLKVLRERDILYKRSLGRRLISRALFIIRKVIKELK